MKDISKELIDWAIKSIEENFKDDVSLLIGHEHWKIPSDGDNIWFNFFIPSSDRGYKLSKTFIIEGVGYDLFPMSWERVEGLANLNESLTNCLADGVVLYSRSDEDKKRFEDLKEKLKSNLADKEFAYGKGLEKLNTAMELYKNMIFEDQLKNVWKASGYVANYLSQAVAMINGEYFRRGPENQIAILNGFKELPENFTKLYGSIIESTDADEIKKACFEMIKNTRVFFEERQTKDDDNHGTCDYEELAAWYEEGVYTFRRIEHYSSVNDVFNSFAWGYSFQQEFDSIEKEFNLEKMDLMSTFDSKNLEPFRQKSMEIKEYLAKKIVEGGVAFREYDTLEEFLKING